MNVLLIRLLGDTDFGQCLNNHRVMDSVFSSYIILAHDGFSALLEANFSSRRALRRLDSTTRSAVDDLLGKEGGFFSWISRVMANQECRVPHLMCAPPMINPS